MKKTTLAAFALVIVGVLIFISVYFRASNGDNPSARENVFSESGKLSKLTFEDYSGNIVGINDFKGRPMIINSWAVWCPFCEKELLDFADIQNELKDDILIIAVHRQMSREQAKEFTDSLGVSGDLMFLLDKDDSFYKAIGGFSMPETVFIDKSGFIKHQKRGAMPKDEVIDKIKSIMD